MDPRKELYILLIVPISPASYPNPSWSRLTAACAASAFVGIATFARVTIQTHQLHDAGSQVVLIRSGVSSCDCDGRRVIPPNCRRALQLILAPDEGCGVHPIQCTWTRIFQTTIKSSDSENALSRYFLSLGPASGLVVYDQDGVRASDLIQLG